MSAILGTACVSVIIQDSVFVVRLYNGSGVDVMADPAGGYWSVWIDVDEESSVVGCDYGGHGIAIPYRVRS